jgi:ATP-binding cassette subfamily C protein
LYAAERAAEGTRSQQLHASVTGARTIRALRLQDAHMATITGTSQRAVRLALAAASVRARFFSALNAAELVGLGTVLAVSYPLVQSDTITVGGATAAALYFYRLFDPVGALLTQLDTAQSAGAALARLVGVTSLPAGPRSTGSDPSVPADDRPPAGPPAARPAGRALPPSDAVGAAGEPVPAALPEGELGPDSVGPRSPGASDGRVGPAGRGRSRPGDAGSVPTSAPTDGDAAADSVGGGSAGVRLRGVSFSYDRGRPALEDVDLVVGPGERVALVGPSGAGKSTVAKLVAGVHRPSQGVVDVDVGGRVTLVTQEVHVFAGPLAADLRLARPEATDGELRAALDRVGATPWVEALDDGLDTVVGEVGHQLSPTQAQQLALARLLLADPAVAILDEATAEAGSAGAGVLDDAAAAVVAGRTSLVIAHRLTQAAAADRIVVLDRGRVVEQGTPDELLAADGLYADLWSAWSAWSAWSSGVARGDEVTRS